tara:strand:- start:316 stop:609 length:294 start_codon:yes stop_codon:yes gene_type:complete
MSLSLLEKNPQITSFVSNVKKKFDLSDEDILDLFQEKKKIVLPITIFNDKLGMLESASLYMKDKLNLSFKEIAELLERDYKTIWTSYSKAKQKLKKE